MSDMTIAEAFAEVGRIINTHFPAPPDRGYVGNRCGWYPEKPKRRRKARA
jgi:hypothetical protein